MELVILWLIKCKNILMININNIIKTYYKDSNRDEFKINKEK